MKIKPRELLRSAWRGLTDVPGWPDAPSPLRLRRSLPIVLPVLATSLLVAWDFGYTAPRLRAAQTAHEPLLKLEQEVAALRLAFSEQQITEIVAQEAALQRQLPHSAQEIREVLKAIQREGQKLGWDASCSAPAMPEPKTDAEACVAEVPVRMRLRPVAGNTEPFNSLLTLLERLPTLSRRIGLMRLSIGADEGKWQAVEAGLRFTVPLPHAQVPQ